MNEITQEYETTVVINDHEYQATVEYIDDGAYFINPYPKIIIQKIVISPNKFRTVDLMDSDYYWLLDADQELDIMEEIKSSKEHEFWAAQQELRSA